MLIRATFMTFCVALLGGGFGAANAPASASLTKPQYIKQGDAICAKAIAQFKALGPATTMASVASKGTRWLAIDNATLKAMHALRPAPADAASIKVLLAGAQSAVNETASAIKAAKAGTTTAFVAHAKKSVKLTRHWQSVARAFGFRTCTHWGD